MKDDGGWLRWWDLVRNLRWVKKVDLERAIVLEREINREWLYIYAAIRKGNEEFRG